MRVYELAPFGEPPEAVEYDHLPFDVDTKSAIYLPGMHCPECNDPNHYRGYYACAMDLPFALSRRQRAKVKALIDSYRPRALPGFEGIQTSVPVLLPEDFSALARDLRRLLGIPPHFFIRPHARVGPKRVYLLDEVTWDIRVHAGDMYLSRRGAKALWRSGLKGFALFPMEVELGDEEMITDCMWVELELSGQLERHREWWYRRKVMPLYELVVWGRGGIPKTDPDGFWWQCKRCKRWYLGKYQEYRLELDSQQWDGSDFFHFAECGNVHVTERAKEWLENLGLVKWVGFISPRPGSFWDEISAQSAHRDFMLKQFGSDAGGT